MTQALTIFTPTPLAQALLEKLDDLAHGYRKATGCRVNRNDIVRHLVEGCSLESLSGLKPLERQKGKLQ